MHGTPSLRGKFSNSWPQPEEQQQPSTASSWPKIHEKTAYGSVRLGSTNTGWHLPLQLCMCAFFMSWRWTPLPLPHCCYPVPLNLFHLSHTLQSRKTVHISLSVFVCHLFSYLPLCQCGGEIRGISTCRWYGTVREWSSYISSSYDMQHVQSGDCQLPVNWKRMQSQSLKWGIGAL